MADLFSKRERRRPGDREFRRDEDEPKGDGGLIGWAIFIFLLIGLVALCWMGSIYIFGHPEEPLSYSLLHKFHKLDPPQRFIDTAAPKGEFLDADKLLERYGTMSKRDLEKESARLRRDFIRNYESTKGLVPYARGNFQILDSYQLTPEDFFTSGVVAVAQDSKQPQVLIEHVFTADEKIVPIVHRNLLTGQPITLERTRQARDLAAIINVARLDDGRLKFTVVPISYPGYAVATGPGSFSLEPPKTLNVEAGLPITSKAKQREADERFANYRRKAAEKPGEVEETELVRIQPALGVDGATPEPVVASATPVPVATPVPTPVAPPTVADADIEVRAAIPVDGSVPPTPTPPPTVATAPTVGSDVPLKPFIATNEPAPAITNTAAGSWQTYNAGQMPRGRLVGLKDAKALADTGIGGERVYLQGDFVVTAAGPGRAVLRSRSGEGAGARVIVQYPAGRTPPSEKASVNRGRERPFLIQSVERGSDGTINIKAQEITNE